MQRCAKYLVILAAAFLVSSGCSELETEIDMPEPGEARVESDRLDSEPEEVSEAERVYVLIETSTGNVKAELWPERAPETVDNFLRYVDDGFFDGTIFHRVIDDFMIQGGGFTVELREKSTDRPIKNEARPDVPNRAGTLAMARTSDPHSATAQFFINLKHNQMLDRGKCPDGWGYAVFGKVVDGMEVVEEIGGVRTHTAPNGMDDVPVEPVVIKSIRRADAE